MDKDAALEIRYVVSTQASYLYIMFKKLIQ